MLAVGKPSVRPSGVALDQATGKGIRAAQKMGGGFLHQLPPAHSRDF